MKKFLLCTIFGIFLTPQPASFAEAGDDHQDREDSQAQHKAQDGLQIVTGEVVDLSCYLGQKARGPSHKQCAIACAKKGVPMGILTDKDELFLLIEDHENASAYKKAIEHAAETVSIRGKVYHVGGLQALRVAETEYKKK